MSDVAVAEGDDGKRLSAFLRAACELSQKQARDLCSIGAAAIDGVCAAATARVRTGQQVTLLTDYVDLMLQLGLCVAYADDHVIVIHKPPGLAVHTGPLVEQSVADALAELPGAGLAQRIDREASGLLLVGRDADTLQQLGAAMEAGRISREYDAITHGVIEADERTVDQPLTVTDEPRGDRPKTIADPKGQHAISHLRVLARRSDATLVRVRLETGRTHQIRAHLAHIGHPLLGDPRYGDAAANERARATYGVHRTMLHGARLRFPHPTDGREIEVTSMREPDFARMFRNP